MARDYIINPIIEAKADSLRQAPHSRNTPRLRGALIYSEGSKLPILHNMREEADAFRQEEA